MTGIHEVRFDPLGSIHVYTKTFTARPKAARSGIPKSRNFSPKLNYKLQT